MISVKERTAPKGKFRIVFVDTFSNEDFVLSTHASLQAAKAKCDKTIIENPSMTKVYTYDDKGNMVYERGNF
jgi:hypothetical protein